MQFSGGKDSLACLYLLEPHWEEMIVCWANAGAPLPGTRRLMDRIAEQLPYFQELTSTVLDDIAENGWPSDIVPTEMTPAGRAFSRTEGLNVRIWVECCHRNMWAPMQSFIQHIGATTIIRAVRRQERLRGVDATDPALLDEGGPRILHPIFDWTAEHVRDFLEQRGIEVLPEYEFTKAGLDCWCCTAYLELHKGKLQYLAARQQELYRALGNVPEQIYNAAAEEAKRLAAMLAEDRESAAAFTPPAAADDSRSQPGRAGRNSCLPGHPAAAVGKAGSR